MKKILSLLLCLALLAGLLASAAAADAEDAEQLPVGEAFTAAVAPQAFAATMAAWLSDTGEGVSLTDPLFAWDAAGWYAAWLYRTENCDLLSPETVNAFLRSLDAEVGAMPEGWEEYGVVRVLHSLDGSVYYDFVQHKTEIDEMLGVSTMVSFIESGENALTTVLTCYYEEGLQAEWMYALDFERESGESVFPYRLTGLQLLEDGPQMDEALDFTWAELMNANRLENVLALYPALHVTSLSPLAEDGESAGTWLFRQDGSFVRVDEGEDSFSGECRGCSFELEKNESGERVRIGRILAGGASSLDSFITDFLTGVVIVEREETEDELIRLVCTYRGGYRERIAIDRGTLVLREIGSEADDAPPSGATVFDYTQPAPDFPFLESWDGALRTVTTVWEDFRRDAETGDWNPCVETRFDRLPADWEYLPYEARRGEYALYMDEGYTRPYAYPGDGLDYTLYLTTAKG